jgi:drug/metabolite transporter (DMT)-like permease
MKRGILFALCAASLYGINIVYARMATSSGVMPADLVLFRVIFLFVICLPFMKSFSVEREKILPLIALGIASATVGLAYFTAVKYISVSEAAPLFYTFPLWILLFTPLIIKTKPDNRLYGLFAVAFVGLCLIIGFSFKLPDYRGVIAALIASLAATAQFFMAKRVSDGLTPVTVLFFVNLVIFPIALSLALFQGGPSHPSLLLNVAFPVFMVGAAYAGAFALQMEASKAAPPAVIGLVFCLEPVVALVASALLLGESLAGVQFIGAGLVIAALITASYLQLRKV